MTIQAMCVFCGSKTGLNPEFLTAAQKLGKLLAQKKIKLIYGGGRLGLMGTLAQSVIAHNGHVIGIIPAFFLEEVRQDGITELLVVDSMHERKAKMQELADCFVALPGGVGTLEEIAEAITWSQLGLHNKPCGFLNTAGFYNQLLNFFHTVAGENMLYGSLENLFTVANTPADLLKELNHRSQQPLAKLAKQHLVK